MFEKCAVLFGNNSLKLSILFDRKSEKVFTIVGSNYPESVIAFLFFFVKCFTVWLRFPLMHPVFILLGSQLDTMGGRGGPKPFHALAGICDLTRYHVFLILLMD